MFSRKMIICPHNKINQAEKLMVELGYSIGEDIFTVFAWDKKKDDAKTSNKKIKLDKKQDKADFYMCKVSATPEVWKDIQELLPYCTFELIDSFAGKKGYRKSAKQIRKNKKVIKTFKLSKIKQTRVKVNDKDIDVKPKEK